MWSTMQSIMVIMSFHVHTLKNKTVRVLSLKANLSAFEWEAPHFPAVFWNSALHGNYYRFSSLKRNVIIKKWAHKSYLCFSWGFVSLVFRERTELFPYSWLKMNTNPWLLKFSFFFSIFFSFKCRAQRWDRKGHRNLAISIFYKHGTAPSTTGACFFLFIFNHRIKFSNYLWRAWGVRRGLTSGALR